jgi:hypothetical protein
VAEAATFAREPMVMKSKFENISSRIVARLVFSFSASPKRTMRSAVLLTESLFNVVAVKPWKT